MFSLRANVPRWIIIIMDLVFSFVALIFAYLIRFDLKADMELVEKEWEILSKSIGVFFAVKLFVFYFFKINKGLVRHTSTEDIRRIFFAFGTSSLFFLALGFFLTESLPSHQSVFLCFFTFPVFPGCSLPVKPSCLPIFPVCFKIFLF